MSRRIFFRTSEGDIAIPVSDGDFFTQRKISKFGDINEVYFEFFSDQELTQPVTPTGGTITISGSPLGNTFLLASQNSTIDATTVSFPDATYVPPVLDGLIKRAKISMSGVTGANYLKAALFSRDQ